MEFKTLSELVNYVESALALKFYSGSGVLRKSALRIIASVVGGALYMISLLAKRIYKNHFVSTCDIAALDSFGVEYGIPHKAATFARGYVSIQEITGNVTIPADTYFVDTITKLEYSTITSTVVNTGSPNVLVIASGVGSQYNLAVETALQFRDGTPSNVGDRALVAAGGIDNGYSVDVEIDGDLQQWGENADEYRSRLLARIQNPPQGGSKNDYEKWAERFDFVSKSYVISGTPNPNSVNVVLANYNSEAVALTTQQVNQVNAYINSDARRCITADVRVFSGYKCSFGVTGKVEPFNDAVKYSVNNAVETYLRSIYPGNSKSFEDVENFVKSNSLATNYKITGVTRGGFSQDKFEIPFSSSARSAGLPSVTTNFYNF